MSSENETQLKFADWSEKRKLGKLSFTLGKMSENSSLPWIQFNVERSLNKKPERRKWGELINFGIFNSSKKLTAEKELAEWNAMKFNWDLMPWWELKEKLLSFCIPFRLSLFVHRTIHSIFWSKELQCCRRSSSWAISLLSDRDEKLLRLLFTLHYTHPTLLRWWWNFSQLISSPASSFSALAQTRRERESVRTSLGGTKATNDERWASLTVHYAIWKNVISPLLSAAKAASCSSNTMILI